MTTLIYRFEGDTPKGVLAPVERLVEWKPGVSRWWPPGKPRKYLAYSLFHWAGIFANGDYRGLFLYEGVELRASMLVVPAYFKWPFMGADDVQFTYVIALSEERGRGWGTRLLQEAVRHVQGEGRHLWYVTDSGNVASRRLAEKVGFVLRGHALRRGRLFRRLELSPLESYEGEA